MATQNDTEISNKRDTKIGSGECRVGDIVRILKTSKVAGELVNGWKSLARFLDTPDYLVKKHAQNILLNISDPFEVTNDILNHWVDSSQVEPTIGMLIDGIESMQWIQFADDIKDHFAIPR